MSTATTPEKQRLTDEDRARLKRLTKEAWRAAEVAMMWRKPKFGFRPVDGDIAIAPETLP